MKNAETAADADVWIVVDTMGTGHNAMVFENGRPRHFPGLHRRQHFTDSTVSAKLATVISNVVDRKRPDVAVAKLRDGSTLNLLAAPVLGPRDEAVFAVQILFTRGDGSNFEADRRRIGAYEFHPMDTSTHHGLTMETEILHAPEPKTVRSSQEIFSNFEEMPGWTELAQFITAVQQRTCTDDTTFTSELLMTRLDGVERQIFMTFRAYRRADDEWIVRGLVHDISDVKEPKRTTGFNASLMRKAFEMTPRPDKSGIGHFNIPTRVLTEWFHEPPSPLLRWATEVPELDYADQEKLGQELDTLSAGLVPEIAVEVHVKFRGEGWVNTLYEVQVASSGDSEQGLLRVTPLDPAPGDPPPPDPDSGILAW